MSIRPLALTFLLTLAPAVLAAPPVDSIVVFNEINYNPVGTTEEGEWIEITNVNALAIDLSGWRLTGGVDYTFPADTVIEGGAYLIVAKNPAASGVPGALGPWTGTLSNDSETIRLRDNSDRLLDEVNYGDKGDWPVPPDGSGATLTKRRSATASPLAASWTFSPQPGGTPGVMNFPPPPTISQAALTAFHSTWKYSTAAQPADWKDAGFDDSAWASAQAGFHYGGALVYDDPPPSAASGSWSLHTWTGDADSQISGARTYTHKVAVGRASAINAINGVTFSTPGTALNGANWSLTGALNRYAAYTATGLTAGSGSRQLCEEFYYGASNADGTSRLELSGLTPGNSYIFTLYFAGWDPVENRKMLITASDGNTSVQIDQDTRGSAQGVLAKYLYKAPASGVIGFKFFPLSSGATWHHYAFSNEATATVMPDETAISGVAVSAFSSELGTPYNRRASMLVDGSGLTNAAHGTVPDGSMWLSNGTLATPNDTLPAEVVFDLGSVQDLTSLRIWNYNEATSGLMTRGANLTEISTAVNAGGPFTVRNTVSLRRAYGITSEIGERVPLAVTGVRYVKLNIISNHGGTGSVGGLSEVKFFRPGLPPGPTPTALTQQVDTIYGSGMGNDGQPLAPGGADPHYTLLTGSAHTVVAQVNNAAWLPNDSTSQWIGLTSNGNDSVAVGQWTYRTSFDLTGYSLPSLNVRLYVAADNSLDLVTVNGSTLAGASGGSFNAYSGPFTIPAASLLAGVNTVDFKWSNAGTGANPGGLKVKWDAARPQTYARTALPSNPLTSYFRQTITAPGVPGSTYQLALQHVVADGAVFYLNGTEIHRYNMPAGTITAATPALSTLAYPKFSSVINVPGTAMQPGANALAVELHQAAANDAQAFFAATLDATIIPPADTSAAQVNIAEVAAATAAAGSFFVELQNPAASPVNIAGWLIRSSSGAEAVLTGSIPAGGRLAVTESMLGFRPLDGEKLFLLTAAGAALYDGVVVKNAAQARGADDAWLVPDALTPGTPNTFTVQQDVVINEIMYHHAPVYLPTGTTDDPEEWIELYNKGTAAVDLTGWKLRGGADFDFAPGTSIAPGTYLVVAKDPATLLVKYPAITITGPLSGSLSNSGDTVRLEDANGNPANTVTYHSGGRWDGLAGGGGSSLELVNPALDNSRPEAWSASDESSKSAWQSFSYQGTGTPPAGSTDPTQYNEFVFGLLNSGDFLIDDISVKEVNVSNRELIQNGGFETSTAGQVPATWRLLGNHGGHGQSLVAPDGAGKVLRVKATGTTEHMHNHCETTLKSGSTFVTLSNASTYNISFRAKWLSGSPRLHTRLYFNRLARQHLLPMPSNTGTPGAQNSRYQATAYPAFYNMTHFPVVPPVNAACTVRVQSAYSPGLTGVVLHWKKDTDLTWTDAAMSASGGGWYEAVIPGQAAGVTVQFYTTATGAGGVSADYPRAGAASRALIRWNDGTPIPAGVGHAFRILQTAGDNNWMHDGINVMSNHSMPCTVIYRDTEIYYDASVSLKSSQRGRLGDTRVGFAVDFDPMQPFRGVHLNVNLDRSSIGRGTTGSGFGQCEIIHWQFMNRAGNTASMYNDLVYALPPRTAHTGSAQLTMAEFNDVYLDSQYANGGDGPTFKYELIYYPTTTNTGGPEGFKIAQPDNVVYLDINALNTPSDKESYRWHFLIGNARTNDDYSRVIALNQALRLSAGPAFVTQCSAACDVDQWLRNSAAMTLCGVVDHYSDGTQHNLKLYARPSDGRMLMLPWDHDFMHTESLPTMAVIRGADLTKIVTSNPAWEKLLWVHLHDMLNTSFKSSYLTAWGNRIQPLLTGGQTMSTAVDFLVQRAAYVQSQCSALYPSQTFAISTNGGGDFSTASFTAPLSGDGPIQLHRLRIQGSEETLPVTWTKVAVAGGNKFVWTISVPVRPGLNAYVIEGLDYRGNVLSTDTINITGTGAVLPAAAASLVISELNYHPADSTPAEVTAGFPNAEDFEFIELKNIHPTAAIDLTGCRFVNGIVLNLPARTLTPGECYVLPRRTAAFLVRYPGVSAASRGPEYFTSVSNSLSNGGEQLALVDAAGADIKRFTYGDDGNWPAAADGGGPTLTLIAPEANPDHGNAFNWRASFAAGGTPCATDSTTPPADPNADTDGDGVSDLVESVIVPTAAGAPFTVVESPAGITISIERDTSTAAAIRLETSSALTGWTAVPWDTVTRTQLDATHERLSWTLPPAQQRLFARGLVLVRE